MTSSANSIPPAKKVDYEATLNKIREGKYKIVHKFDPQDIRAQLIDLYARDVISQVENQIKVNKQRGVETPFTDVRSWLYFSLSSLCNLDRRDEERLPLFDTLSSVAGKIYEQIVVLKPNSDSAKKPPTTTGDRAFQRPQQEKEEFPPTLQRKASSSTSQRKESNPPENPPVFPPQHSKSKQTNPPRNDLNSLNKTLAPKPPTKALPQQKPLTMIRLAAETNADPADSEFPAFEEQKSYAPAPNKPSDPSPQAKSYAQMFQSQGPTNQPQGPKKRNK